MNEAHDAKKSLRCSRIRWTRLEAVRYQDSRIVATADQGSATHLGTNLAFGRAPTMSPANSELQRLLRLLAETATKAEQEAYATGWRDCRVAIFNALAAVGDEPRANGFYAPEAEAAAPVIHVEPRTESAWQTPISNGNGADGSYTN
jgi:hypothetical protein